MGSKRSLFENKVIREIDTAACYLRFNALSDKSKCSSDSTAIFILALLASNDKLFWSTR